MISPATNRQFLLEPAGATLEALNEHRLFSKPSTTCTQTP